MLLGYGLAIAILREIYLHWRDTWREPDSYDNIFKLIIDSCAINHKTPKFPLTLKQRLEMTRQFMRRDRDIYGPQHTYRLDNIHNYCQLLIQDMSFAKATAWYDYGLRICADNETSHIPPARQNPIIDKSKLRAIKAITTFKLAAARYHIDRHNHLSALTLLDQIVIALPDYPQADPDVSHKLCQSILSDRLRVLAALKHQDLDSTALELLTLVEVINGPVSEAVLGLLKELLRFELSVTTRSRLETHRRLLEEVISVKSALGEESIYMVQCLEGLARFYRFKSEHPFHFSLFKPQSSGHFPSFKPNEHQDFSSFKPDGDLRFSSFKSQEPPDFSSFKPQGELRFSTFKAARTVCFCSFKPSEHEQAFSFCRFKRSEPDYHEALMHKAEQIKAVNRIKRLPYAGFLEDMELAASFYDERDQGADRTTAFHLRRRALLISRGEIKVRGYTPILQSK